MDRTQRAVMAVLVRRGHYPETPDGFARAVVDAQDIVAAWRTGATAPVGLAVGEALHPRRCEVTDEARCYHGDLAVVWEAFHQTERNVA